MISRADRRSRRRTTTTSTTSRWPRPTHRTRCASSPARSAARSSSAARRPGFRPMQVWIGDDDGRRHERRAARTVGRRAQRLPRAVRRPPRCRPAPPHVQGARSARRDRAPSRVRIRAGQHRPRAIRSGRKHSSCRARRTAPSSSSPRSTRTSGHAPSSSPTAREHGPNMHPRWWVDPEPHTGPRGLLRRVVLSTPNLASAVGFFSGLLQGEVLSESDTESDTSALGRAGVAGRRSPATRAPYRRRAGHRSTRGRGPGGTGRAHRHLLRTGHALMLHGRLRPS